MFKVRKFLVFICLISLTFFVLNINLSIYPIKTTLAATSQITGCVLTPDGEVFIPSQNSYVTVVLTIKASKFIEYETNVNDEGFFSFTVEDEYNEEYTIVAHARGIENPYASSLLLSGYDFNSQSGRLRLMMPVVEGKVLDPSGNPLDDYTGIKVTTSQYYFEGPVYDSTSCMVNEDGSFKIGKSELGYEYFYITASIDYEKNSEVEYAGYQELIKLDNSWGSVVHKDIRLTQKPTVQGRVYYQDGTPFNPANHDGYEITFEPIGGYNNDKTYFVKVDNNGFYKIGGNITHGSTFVIKGYAHTMLYYNYGSAQFRKYENIIPKTIIASENEIQNVELTFGSSAADLKMVSAESVLEDVTYSIGGSMYFSKNLTGNGNVKFIVDGGIDVSGAKYKIISNINFTSYPEAYSAIFEYNEYVNIVFKNCEFSESMSVIKNLNYSTTKFCEIRFENCRINNIYGDVFYLNEKDKVYLKDCTISNCSSLSNRPDAIIYEGDNKIADILPQNSGALICGRVLNPDGSACLPDEFHATKVNLIFENINNKAVYEIPDYYGRYALKEGIPDGKYKVSYKRDYNYIKGIDTGLIVDINRALTCVQDIVIYPENVNINIDFLDSNGEIFDIWEHSDNSTRMAVSFSNESGEYIKSYLHEWSSKFQLVQGNYKVQAYYYVDRNLVGTSEPFDISVGKTYTDIYKTVELKPVVDKAAFKGDGWIQNTENGHYYKTTSTFVDTYEEAEKEAVELGGHLVTINDQNENDWLECIWGSLHNQYWIGYNYNRESGYYKWTWMSNEETNYTNWFAGIGLDEFIRNDDYALFNVINEECSWEGNKVGKWCSSVKKSNISGIIEVDELPAPTPTYIPSTPTYIPSTPTPTPMVTPTPSMIIGDVNSDQIFNSIDFAYMRQYLLGIISDLPSQNDLYSADVNGDSKINAIDFAYMRKYLLGMIESFPKEAYQ